MGALVGSQTLGLWQIRLQSRNDIHVPYPDTFQAIFQNNLAFRKQSTGFVNYNDYEWAEVARMATSCNTKDSVEYEGYSSGLLKNKNKTSYGCWFHRYRGGGIFVNVGKTIIARTRKELMMKLHIPNCGNQANCNHSYDYEYCSHALRLGYDSIQIITMGHYNRTQRPELILCSGQCGTVTFNTSCPPGVELRTGVNGSKSCTCDDSIPIMNCGYSSPSVTHKECNRYTSSVTEMKRKTCFLLGDSISHSPVNNTNITILYLNNGGQGQGSHHNHIISNNISHYLNLATMNMSESVSGPVYVLTSSNVTLSGGGVAVEYQLVEYNISPPPTSPSTPITTTTIDKSAVPVVSERIIDIPVQNMYIDIHSNNNNTSSSSYRLLSMELPKTNPNSRYRNYDIKGIPLGVIAISGMSTGMGTGAVTGTGRRNHKLHHIRFDNDIINHIIDESVCMRRAGVSIVIVMVYGRIDRSSYHNLSHQLKGYVDVILEDLSAIVVSTKTSSSLKSALSPPLLSVKHNYGISFVWNEKGEFSVIHLKSAKS
eukprot:gene3260-6451_t